MFADIKYWEYSSGRAPYSQSYRAEEGITLFWNARLDHCLMEISGRGCEWLRSKNLLSEIFSRMSPRMTRIDLAVDLLTSVTPPTFLEKSQSARFKSRGSVVSESGETNYVGSMKSERYCRVYRYAPPHPRSAFLRTEFVFRKQNAKLFAEQCLQCDFDYVALALGAGQVYGFEHEAWDLTGDEIALDSWTPERANGKTLRWLISQVSPAFKKLVREGVIDDPVEFLEKYFLTER